MGVEFAKIVTEVVVACETGAESTLPTRILLRCYDEKAQQAEAAQGIGWKLRNV